MLVYCLANQKGGVGKSASAGFYESRWTGTKHPRLQLLMVGELLAGKRINCPPLGQLSRTFKRAPKTEREEGEQLPLVAETPGDYERKKRR